LYRRYRPQTFSEVIGQEHVTEPLSQALRTGRVSHAYLFSGPRGCGKTTCARILARCLNCEKGPTPEPCGECASCRELGRGGSGSLDVVEIDAASHGGVDDTRDLREKAIFAPARDRYKVFVLDEAHMVSREGFNALLKIVEEPPPHIKFIFATTEPNKVLPTIRSRSHHYPFRLVPPGLMTSYMEQLSQLEEVEVAPGVMSMVVRAGGGSVRDTESVLDQLIGGSVDGRVTYERAASLLGFTPDALIGQMIDALDRGDGAAMFAVIESVVESGLEPHRFAEDLLERLRDLIVLAAAGPAARPALRGLPEDQVAALAQQATQFGLARLTRAANAISTGLATMTGATSPRLHLELVAARALLESGADSLAAAPVQQAAAEPPPPTGPTGGWAIPGVTTGSTWAAPSSGAAPAGRTPEPAPDQSARRSAEPARTPPSGSAGRRDEQVPRRSVASREFVDWDEPDGPPPAHPRRASVAPSNDARQSQGRAPEGVPPGQADKQSSRTMPPPTPPAQATAQAAVPTGPQPPSPPIQTDGPSGQGRQVPNAANTVARPTGSPPSAGGSAWDRVLLNLRHISVPAHGLVSHSAQVVAMEPGKITLAFPTAGHAETFNHRFRAAVEEAASAVARHPVRVLATAGGTQPTPATQPAAPTAPSAPAAQTKAAGQVPSPRTASPKPARSEPGRQAAPAPTASPSNAAGAPAGPQAPTRPEAPTALEAPPARTASPKPTNSEPDRETATASLRHQQPGWDRPKPDPEPPEEGSSELSAEPGDPGVRGLTGVPLVMQVLGAEIVEEIKDP
jgi:DNA polymerase-3 subunit gamma/tau